MPSFRSSSSSSSSSSAQRPQRACGDAGAVDDKAAGLAGERENGQKAQSSKDRTVACGVGGGLVFVSSLASDQALKTHRGTWGAKEARRREAENAKEGEEEESLWHESIGERDYVLGPAT